jgi:PmbA protein
VRSEELLEVASQAVSLAQKKGASEAAATASRSREVEIAWRDGKIEKVSEATSRGLSVQLYVEGRYSTVATSDLRPAAVETFLDESIAMARTLARDPFRSLPDPALYEGRASVDLAVHDAKYAELTAETRRQRARELEEAARSAPGAEHIVSVTTNVGDSEWMSARVTSNGFSGHKQESQFGLTAQVTCKDADGRRPEASDWTSARFFGELPGAEPIGRGATARAVGRLGSKKMESGAMTLVVDNRSAGRLVRALLAAMGGRALQQKQSFLEGKLDTAIASAHFDVVDDPFLSKGFGSRLYDGDGIAAKKRTVFERGVLRTFFIDDYYGRKLKTAPTTGGPSNLLFTAGTKSLDDLCRDAKNGILVTGFLGGNSNATTGDYSFGIEGFRIHDGARAEPVAEMNMSGNLGELFLKLAAVGDDPWVYSSMRTPSLVFEGVQVAGL